MQHLSEIIVFITNKINQERILIVRKEFKEKKP